MTLELPVLAPLSSYVRALEAALDAQTDQKARQAVAAVTALASRGFFITVAKKSVGRLEKPEDREEGKRERDDDDQPSRELRRAPALWLGRDDHCARIHPLNRAARMIQAKTSRG